MSLPVRRVPGALLLAPKELLPRPVGRDQTAFDLAIHDQDSGQPGAAEPARDESRRDANESRESCSPPTVAPPELPPSAAQPVEPAAAARPCGARPLPPTPQLAQQMLGAMTVRHDVAGTSVRMEIAAGRLRGVGLDLQLHGGRVRAQFEAPDLRGRDLLRSAVAELEASLAHRGVDVESIQVELGFADPRRDGHGRGGGRGSGHGQGSGGAPHQPAPRQVRVAERSRRRLL